VRTIAFEAADDVEAREFDPLKHSSGDVFDFFTNFIANTRYGPYQASFHQVKQMGMQDLSADFDDESIAITGKPACTYITANIVPLTPEEKREFPSANYADADPDNFLKVYQFAKNEYVLKNLGTILGIVEEIADEKLRRGEMDRMEHARLVAIARNTTNEKAATVLDTIIVTKDNAQEVLTEFGLIRRGRTISLTEDLHAAVVRAADTPVLVAV